MMANLAVLADYLKNPLEDEAFRKACNIPPTKYYTVSVWPIPGHVTVDNSRSREVKAKKISKSDAKTS